MWTDNRGGGGTRIRNTVPAYHKILHRRLFHLVLFCNTFPLPSIIEVRAIRRADKTGLSNDGISQTER